MCVCAHTESYRLLCFRITGPACHQHSVSDSQVHSSSSPRRPPVISHSYSPSVPHPLPGQNTGTPPCSDHARLPPPLPPRKSFPMMSGSSTPGGKPPSGIPSPAAAPSSTATSPLLRPASHLDSTVDSAPYPPPLPPKSTTSCCPLRHSSPVGFYSQQHRPMGSPLPRDSSNRPPPPPTTTSPRLSLAGCVFAFHTTAATGEHSAYSMPPPLPPPLPPRRSAAASGASSSSVADFSVVATAAAASMSN